MQSVLRRILKHTANLPPTLDQVSGWVGAVVRNRCIDVIVKDRIKREGPLVIDPICRDDAARDRTAIQVRRALQLLPDHHRQVLEQTYYDRRSSRVIGERMGLSEGAVRILRFRARKKLKKLLKKLLEDPHDD
jgi:RNA polymerase sigma factor (sigma-70 family)